MTKARLEAFSDGVIAIIITIMVLEMKVPHDPSPSALFQIAPVFLSYVLSFVFVGIYWVNHHHLTPFVTGWMGEKHFAQWPVLAYAVVLLCAAIAYTILAHTLIAANGGKDSHLARAMGSDRKGKISMAIYVLSIAATFLHPLIACAGFVIVAVIWLVPDRRVERAVVE